MNFLHARRFGRSSSTRLGLLLLAGAALALDPAQAQVNRPVEQRLKAAEALGALTIQDLTGPETPASLVQALVGPSVSVSNVTYAGAAGAAGTFLGGTGIIGFEQGILLGSGCVTNTPGPNLYDDVSCITGTPGDPDLDGLIPGYQTFDAAVLEFDFECTSASAISFQYVFTSDEYNEWVYTDFNDVFGFFLNGKNIAIVPGTATTPVSINNVNCNNPYAPPSGSNCGVYVNNDLDDGGGSVATEMDGLTAVFTATATLQPGINHIKLAISDAGDQVYDSNVFIRGESFNCGGSVEPVFDPPTPCGEDLNVNAGVPMSFQVVALATNGLPGQHVTLTASGLPAGAFFTPALPVTGQPAIAAFHWTPSFSDVGLHPIVVAATDQLGQAVNCSVIVDVHSCSQTADAVVLGSPCGAALACDAPQLGHQTSVDVIGATSFAPGAILFSAAGAPPIPFESCVAYLDLAHMQTLKLFVTDDMGDYGFKFPVGTSAGLCGTHAVLQAVVVSAAGPLSIGQATNAVLVTLGS